MVSVEKEAAAIRKENERRRKEIGERLRTLRKAADYNLKKLSEEMSRYGQPLSLSQLSRIEKGEVPINDDQRMVLSTILNAPEDALRGTTKREPWFINKWGVTDYHLQEVLSGVRGNESKGSAHAYLINEKIYQYVPLEPNMDGVDKDDASAEVSLDDPIMRKYLVQIEKVADDVIADKGLVRHSGEEIIFVLSGRVHFWFRQPDSITVEERLLVEKDCVHFSSGIYHAFSSADEHKPAQALFVFSDIQMTPKLVLEKHF